MSNVRLPCRLDVTDRTKSGLSDLNLSLMASLEEIVMKGGYLHISIQNVVYV